METYTRIAEIVDNNLILCLIPLLLSLMLIAFLFRNKFKTKKALNVVRWIIIFYTAITLVYFIVGIAFAPEKFAFTNRATGPYWFAYWLMLCAATVLPFTLLIKKLAAKFWYVLFIAFCMKIGFYFERFVIIVSSIHRDYFPMEQNSTWPGFPVFLVLYFLQGLVIAITLLGIIEITERIQLRKIYSQKK